EVTKTPHAKKNKPVTSEKKKEHPHAKDRYGKRTKHGKKGALKKFAKDLYGSESKIDLSVEETKGILNFRSNFCHKFHCQDYLIQINFYTTFSTEEILFEKVQDIAERDLLPSRHDARVFPIAPQDNIGEKLPQKSHHEFSFSKSDKLVLEYYARHPGSLRIPEDTILHYIEKKRKVDHLILIRSLLDQHEAKKRRGFMQKHPDKSIPPGLKTTMTDDEMEVELKCDPVPYENVAETPVTISEIHESDEVKTPGVYNSIVPSYAKKIIGSLTSCFQAAVIQLQRTPLISKPIGHTEFVDLVLARTGG
ncbi:unnamed protein product, partial [Allacma fusca]